MKTSFVRVVLAFAFLSASSPSSAKSPEHGDDWLVLDKITHKRDYTIETRDHKCVMGTIARVSVDRLTAKIYRWNSSGLARRCFARGFWAICVLQRPKLVVGCRFDSGRRSGAARDGHDGWQDL